MAEDFIPPNDAEFHIFQKQFVNTIAENPSKCGATAEDVTGLKGAQTAWDTAYPAHIKAQEDARTATQVKETVRGKLETFVRSAARKVNGTVGVDNATRVSVGLPPRDETRGRVNPPTTRPIGRLEPARPHTLVLHFVDEQTPTRLAKPEGAQGCQVWSYVGESAPADATSYAFLALDTRTPYADEHTRSEAGKNAYYLLRWQNSKGETGPWSDVVTAKIP
jgi:hypothetical protein